MIFSGLFFVKKKHWVAGWCLLISMNNVHTGMGTRALPMFWTPRVGGYSARSPPAKLMYHCSVAISLFV